MTHELFIVGAGNFGREVLDWARAVPATQRDWDVAGFLDSRPDALQGTNCTMPIVGAAEDWQVRSSHRFVIAIGEPRDKLKYAQLLSAKGAIFASVIHPTAIIGSNSVVGKGGILCPYSVLTANVVLGDHVIINCHSSVGHDAVLGEGCTLSAHCDVTGHARLGRGVLLGSNASILPRAIVGDFAIVGPGSVVLKRVKPSVTVMGVPAKEVFVHALR